MRVEFILCLLFLLLLLEETDGGRGSGNKKANKNVGRGGSGKKSGGIMNFFKGGKKGQQTPKAKIDKKALKNQKKEAGRNGRKQMVQMQALSPAQVQMLNAAPANNSGKKRKGGGTPVPMPQQAQQIYQQGGTPPNMDKETAELNKIDENTEKVLFSPTVVQMEKKNQRYTKLSGVLKTLKSLKKRATGGKGKGAVESGGGGVCNGKVCQQQMQQAEQTIQQQMDYVLSASGVRSRKARRRRRKRSPEEQQQICQKQVGVMSKIMAGSLFKKVKEFLMFWRRKKDVKGSNLQPLNKFNEEGCLDLYMGQMEGNGQNKQQQQGPPSPSRSPHHSAPPPQQQMHRQSPPRGYYPPPGTGMPQPQGRRDRRMKRSDDDYRRGGYARRSSHHYEHHRDGHSDSSHDDDESSSSSTSSSSSHEHTHRHGGHKLRGILKHNNSNRIYAGRDVSKEHDFEVDNGTFFDQYDRKTVTKGGKRIYERHITSRNKSHIHDDMGQELNTLFDVHSGEAIRSGGKAKKIAKNVTFAANGLPVGYSVAENVGRRKAGLFEEDRVHGFKKLAGAHYNPAPIAGPVVVDGTRGGMPVPYYDGYDHDAAYYRRHGRRRHDSSSSDTSSSSSFSSYEHDGYGNHFYHDGVNHRGLYGGRHGYYDDGYYGTYDGYHNEPYDEVYVLGAPGMYGGPGGGAVAHSSGHVQITTSSHPKQKSKWQVIGNIVLVIGIIIVVLFLLCLLL